MDQIRETLQDAEEVSKIISQSIGDLNTEGLDDQELLKELEGITKSDIELNNEMKKLKIEEKKEIIEEKKEITEEEEELEKLAVT